VQGKERLEVDVGVDADDVGAEVVDAMLRRRVGGGKLQEERTAEVSEELVEPSPLAGGVVCRRVRVCRQPQRAEGQEQEGGQVDRDALQRDQHRQGGGD